MARSLLMPALCLLWFAGVQAAQITEDPLERQVLEIAKDLRCAVCQNQPVAESNADLAKDMRAVIREQLRAGKSRAQIMDYFVQRYGDFVLLKPPLERAGLPLWLAPPVLLLAAAGFAFLFLRRRVRSSSPAVSSLSPEDETRVRALRERQGP